MDSDHKPNIAFCLIFFNIVGITAYCLLLTACIDWLSCLLGARLPALLITAGVFLLLALVSYLFGVRSAIQRFNERVDDIIQVTHSFRRGFDRIRRLLGGLFG